MLYPRVSVCVVDLTEEELIALAASIEEEQHRREVRRRAEELIEDERRQHEGSQRAFSQHQVDAVLRRQQSAGDHAPQGHVPGAA